MIVLSTLFTGRGWTSENVVAGYLAVVFSAVYVLLVVTAHTALWSLMVLPVVAVCLAMIMRFEIAGPLLVLSLFVDFHFLGFSSSVWAAPLFAASYVVHRQKIFWKEVRTPLTSALIVYGLCIVPSFMNSSVPLVSAAKLFNVLAFLLVLHTVAISSHQAKDLRLLVGVFLAAVLVNALDVIRLSWMGNSRPFGFAGIMFADYVGLGVSCATAISFVSSGRTRLLAFAVAVIFIFALFLNQTRSIWLVSGLTIGVLLVVLIVRPELGGLQRRRVISMAMAGGIFFMLSGTAAIAVRPEIVVRVTQVTERTEYSIDQFGTKNSLITRLFIWDTAVNAFLEHPYAGIGVYAFPYVSREYYRLPRQFFRRFVGWNSPHQTHLAVMVETGLVGLFGFLTLLAALVRLGVQNLRQSLSSEERRFAVVSAVAIVYCLFSMIVTDAWLWGQGIVLLGMVMGSAVALERVIGLRRRTA